MQQRNIFASKSKYDIICKRFLLDITRVIVVVYLVFIYVFVIFIHVIVVFTVIKCA